MVQNKPSLRFVSLIDHSTIILPKTHIMMQAPLMFSNYDYYIHIIVYIHYYIHQIILIVDRWI